MMVRTKKINKECICIKKDKDNVLEWWGVEFSILFVVFVVFF